MTRSGYDEVESIMASLIRWCRGERGVSLYPDRACMTRSGCDEAVRSKHEIVV